VARGPHAKHESLTAVWVAVGFEASWGMRTESMAPLNINLTAFSPPETNNAQVRGAAAEAARSVAAAAVPEPATAVAAQ
jgi:hypothetical protein